MNDVFDSIMEVLGEDMAYRLCLESGGVRFYLCENPPKNWRMGDEAWAKMYAAFTRDTLEIPLIKRQLSRWLTTTQGHSIARAATMLRTSRTTVRRWLEQDNTHSHPSLFENAR